MTGGCIGGDTDQIDRENALPQLVLRYVVNGGDADQIDCETALPLLVSRYMVNRGCIRVDSDQLDCKSAVPVLVGSLSTLFWSCN